MLHSSFVNLVIVAQEMEDSVYQKFFEFLIRVNPKLVSIASGHFGSDNNFTQKVPSIYCFFIIVKTQNIRRIVPV